MDTLVLLGVLTIVIGIVGVILLIKGRKRKP